jgi:hypothetical protein
MMAKATFNGARLAEVGFRFVRHNDRNETVPCALAAEQAEFEDISDRSTAFGTRLSVAGDEVRVELG